MIACPPAINQIWNADLYFLATHWKLGIEVWRFLLVFLFLSSDHWFFLQISDVVSLGSTRGILALKDKMSQELKNCYQAKSTVQMWQKYFESNKSRNLLIFFIKNESIVIEYALHIFIFRTKSLNSQMSSLPCASRTTSVNFWFSQYLSSSPGKKSACTRPDQILWTSLEVGRYRSFSRYFCFPWLQLKLVEVAVQSWNSTKCIWTATKVGEKSLTIYWQNT